MVIDDVLLSCEQFREAQTAIVIPAMLVLVLVNRWQVPSLGVIKIKVM